VLNQVLAVAPGLGSAILMETRIGLRPLGPDLGRMLGRIAGLDGLVIGNGLGPSGLANGPFAGRLLAQLVLGEAPELDLAAYDSLRDAARLRRRGSQSDRPGRFTSISLRLERRCRERLLRNASLCRRLLLPRSGQVGGTPQDCLPSPTRSRCTLRRYQSSPSRPAGSGSVEARDATTPRSRSIGT
jgi:hypothetical protein